MDKHSKLTLALVTDAWPPQINGVVKTLTRTVEQLRSWDITVEVISPTEHATVPLPIYPEIKLAVVTARYLSKRMKALQPNCIHIATEGTLGLAARRYCLNSQLKFSTSLHTMFPDYGKHIAMFPERLTWAYMRWFHKPSMNILVGTQSVAERLTQKGFSNLRIWSRGIDQQLFSPLPNSDHLSPRPIMIYVGRVSREKSIEDFLKLKLPGSKWVVGDGPHKHHLAKAFPDVKFWGYKHGQELVQLYSNADVFVMPSRTETFGNVIIEALACGLPVAAYPAPGPIDIITSPDMGCCNESLLEAVERALALGDSHACRQRSQDFTWENSTLQFMRGLVLARSGKSLCDSFPEC